VGGGWFCEPAGVYGWHLVRFTLYCRAMGNKTRFIQPGDQDDHVQIIDLGAATHQQPLTAQEEPRLPFLGRRLILGPAIGIGLLSGQVLLAAPAVNPEPPESASALPAVSACEVTEPLRIAGMAASTTDTADAVDNAVILPTGYTVLGVMSEHTNNFVGVGLIHPDGLVEVCEYPVGVETHRVVFSGQSELGALPEGTSYAYTQPAGWTSEGLVLRVAGVRLADGTVVEHLTLPDGRVVPETAITS
jgi:hypothetical protein